MKKPTDRYVSRVYYSRQRLKKYPTLWDALYEEIDAADEMRAELQNLQKESKNYRNILGVLNDREERRWARTRNRAASARQKRNANRKTTADKCKESCRQLARDFVLRNINAKPSQVIMEIKKILKTKSDQWKRQDSTIRGYIIDLFPLHRRPRKKKSNS